MLSAMAGKSVRWQAISASRSWSPAAGPAGRRLAASFDGGLARSFAQRRSADRKLVADRPIAASGDNSVIGVGLRPGGSTRRCSRRDFRRDRRAGQPMKVSSAGCRSHERRRGRLGIEVAVSLQREVIARSRTDGVVSSYFAQRWSRGGAGPAQSSLSNYRLKLTARGRPGASARLRSRAAA